MVVRHLVSGGLAFCVTFSLFYLMQALISAEGIVDDSGRSTIVEFIRLKREAELEIKKRKLPDKTPPDEPPPPPELDLSTSLPDQMLAGVGFGLGTDLELTGGPSLGVAGSDSDVIPVVRVNPQYPMRAAERGIEGWVELEFTITAAGTVKDPVVLASHPGRIFDREALRAIRRWKYNPKFVNGEAVERPGVQVRLRFELSGD